MSFNLTKFATSLSVLEHTWIYLLLFPYIMKKNLYQN